MKNRLFFASGRILAGIGRAQFGPPGSCIAKCLQWSRIVSFFTVCLLVAPPGSRFMQDHSLRAWIWIFHRDHNWIVMSDQHTKRARHAPTCTHRAHLPGLDLDLRKPISQSSSITARVCLPPGSFLASDMANRLHRLNCRD